MGGIMNGPPAQRSWIDRTPTRWFYFIAAVTFFIIALASFGPSVADRSHALAPFTWLIIVHGASVMLWLVLLIVQTLLIQTRRLLLHRRLGISSMLLAALVVILGYAAAVAMLRRGFDISGDLGGRMTPDKEAQGFLFPVLDITEFGLLVVAGYLARHRAAAHKRLMLFATIAMLPAPFAHLVGHNPTLGANPAIMLALILASVLVSGIYDLIRFRRIHPLSLWLGLGLFVVDLVCAIVVGPSAAWQAIAARIAG
jgi:hypothetical protein